MVSLNQGQENVPMREAEIARQVNCIRGQPGEARLVGSGGGAPLYETRLISRAGPSQRATIFAGPEIEFILLSLF